MTTQSGASADVIVIGGGLVGTALAWGLARDGARVTLLDQGDDALRASRGNFGLVWVQGKGYGFAPYATWSRESAQDWPAFANMLAAHTGIDVALKQPGGFYLCFSDKDMVTRRERLGALQNELGDYPFEMLNATELRERLPAVGPQVVGASFTPMDGHVNPLKLLRALLAAAKASGVRIESGEDVQRIDPAAGSFTVHGKRGTYRAAKVVLAAGLGNRALAPLVGLDAPVRPVRGQLLISERVAPFLDYPVHNVRQTDEGTVQFGDSLEEVGFDDTTSAQVLSAIAARGMRAFPHLRDVRIVRTWGALRVYSPDGFPIYDESTQHPGAYLVTCHSGVTLAAVHALRVAPWIAGGQAPDALPAFSARRFENPAALAAAH